MASIQKVKTKKGTQYRVSYDLPKYVDGKRRKTTKTFPIGTTLNEVKQFVAEKELERNRGALVSTNLNLTFEELGDLYFSTYTQFLSPTTLKGYKGAYFNSKPYGLLNYFGKAKVKSIRTRNIQEYINYLCQYVSPKTIKNYWGLLRIFFDLAVQEGIIQREANPMLNKITRPKQERKPVEAYTLEEVILILKLAEEDENPDIKLILNLALLSGIRRGEMAGLKWKNVNFDEGYIYICESRVVVEGGKEYTKPPKTQAGIRKIYIPERLIVVLKEYHQRYLENKVRYGRDFKNKDYVLSKINGEGLTPQGISNNYLRFMERHKDEIRYLKFHGLRHSYSSLLYQFCGGNLKLLQNNLGHSQVNLSLNTYCHSYESIEKEAAKSLQNALKQIV